MPFITEELYQKLPVFEEKKFSISNAPYPESEAELSNKGTQLEADLDYIMGVVRQIRSLSASINLPPSAKPEVFLVFIKGLEKGAQLRKLVETESEFILTLSKVKDVSKVFIILVDIALVQNSREFYRRSKGMYPWPGQQDC